MTPDPHKSLREHLLYLLRGGGADVHFEKAVADIPPALRGREVPPVPHSPWRLLEHLRICQWDILEFSRNPGHVSPPFPDGYWPSGDAPLDDRAWDHAVDAFRTDLAAMCDLIARPGDRSVRPNPARRRADRPPGGPARRRPQFLPPRATGCCPASAGLLARRGRPRPRGHGIGASEPGD